MDNLALLLLTHIETAYQGAAFCKHSVYQRPQQALDRLLETASRVPEEEHWSQ